MKPVYTTTLLCLLIAMCATAAPKYWVGPLNGNWSNLSNWSDTWNGPGGALLPGPLDSVIFETTESPFQLDRRVHLDISSTISAIFVSDNVTMYASTPVTLRLLGSLSIAPFRTFKDSTSEDVPFNIIFNGATQSQSIIQGVWIFEGGVPVNRLAGSGAKFTAEPGSKVTIKSIGESFGQSSGKLIFRNNTNFISSDPSTLIFSDYSRYVLENNNDASIPDATWVGNGVTGSGGVLFSHATIIISGSMNKFTHLAAVPRYRQINADLPNQLVDASLDLPDGTIIDGDLNIINTNNHTLALLAANGAALSVNAEVTSILSIGENTKVAMASSGITSAATSYKLKVLLYDQAGGNFSLQDFANPLGESVLSVTGNILQTGGTFITNSSTVNPVARFVVEMSGPQYSFSRISPDIHPRTQLIKMNSGSIDNGNRMVTLRMIQDLHLAVSPEDRAGADLQSPLEVGKLELLSGTLNTSSASVITVTNTDPLTSVMVGPQKSSYVNGPIRRWTNSTGVYTFPIGSGNVVLTPLSAPCVILPVSAEPSLYQAEYFSAPYGDLNVLAPLKGISKTEYWNTAKISGSDAKVQLILHTAVAGVTDADALVTARYVGGHWMAETGTTLLPGNLIEGLVTSKQLSTLGSFTFGYANPASLVQNTSTGLNYKYYEGSFTALPDFNTLVPVKTGNSNNVDLSIRRIGVNDSFAIVWEGYINIPTAGTYTFETVSDDGSKLYFNSLYSANATALVNNDGIHSAWSAIATVDVPAAGRYPIAVSFFEASGGEDMQVYWSGPGIVRQHIPDAAFREGAPAANSGLNYKYYEGDFNSLPDFSFLAPLKVGKTTNVDISVRPVTTYDHFAFVWEGYINIPTAGIYTFETLSDDGSRLYFNSLNSPGNEPLVNNDGVHASWPATGTVTVAAAGLYPISISYFEKDGNEKMQVYWSGPGIERQLIPDTAFTSTPGLLSSGINYKYYEEAFNSLPDFTTLTPVKSGKTPNIDISVRPAGVNDKFAFIWEGYINIPTAGVYNFETVSDDGSRLYFNSLYGHSNKALVDNDGIHAALQAAGSVEIAAAGLYPVSIAFFEKDGGEAMQVYWTGPGIARQPIPDSVFSSGEVPASFSNSKLVINQLGAAALAERNEVMIYPNPFKENVVISFNNTSVNNKVTVVVYDLNGRLVYNYKSGQLYAGNNVLTLSLDDLRMPEGFYVAKLSVNGVLSKTMKLVKVGK